MTNRITMMASLGLAAMLLGGSLAQAQVTKKGSGYQFRIKFAKGQTTKLKVSATMPSPGQPKPMTVSSMIVQTVTAVTGNVATISGKFGPMMYNGKPMTKEPMVTTAKVDTLGKAVGSSGPSSFTTYPTNPVKVGGTWTSTVPLSGFGGGTASAKFQFIGLKNVNGKQVADIAVSIQSIGQQKTSGTGRLLVLASDGLPYKMQLNLKAPDPQNAGKTIVAPITLTRL